MKVFFAIASLLTLSLSTQVIAQAAVYTTPEDFEQGLLASNLEVIYENDFQELEFGQNIQTYSGGLANVFDYTISSAGLFSGGVSGERWLQTAGPGSDLWFAINSGMVYSFSAQIFVDSGAFLTNPRVSGHEFNIYINGNLINALESPFVTTNEVDGNFISFISDAPIYVIQFEHLEDNGYLSVDNLTFGTAAIPEPRQVAIGIVALFITLIVRRRMGKTGQKTN